MAKYEKRLEAHKLRKSGLSIIAIAKELNVAKSSVSLWCRDLELTKKQRERLRQNSIQAGHRGRMIGALKNKQKRIDEQEHYRRLGKKEIGELSNRDLTIIAASLFWAEGAKTGSRFTFINSDPDMILCMYRFVTEVLKIEKSRILVTIQINKIHESRIHKVLGFWSSLLGLPRSQFGKPYYVNVPPKKKYNNHETYYGIARLRVNNGASLQYKLLGYISALKS
ncbi:hypothetical protein KC851_03975 [Candidatus Kaiserbacteria bacterium]|nr:hypothetical protein [Candidatus Kaiserbacteria bacterium]